MSGDGFSLARFRAVLAKEFIQLLRDRLTFAMMVGLPIMQLLLFGYAINADPRALPTAVIVGDTGTFARSIVRALENTTYFSRRRLARKPRERRGDDRPRPCAVRG
jgi:ABC-2 type transport system permease protein